MKSLSEWYLDCDRQNLERFTDTLNMLKNGNSLTKVLKVYGYNTTTHKVNFVTDTHTIAPAKQWVETIQSEADYLMNVNVITRYPKYERKTRKCAEKMLVAQAHSKTALYFYADYNVEMMTPDPKFILVTKLFMARHLKVLINISRKKIVNDKKGIAKERRTGHKQLVTF